MIPALIILGLAPSVVEAESGPPKWLLGRSIIIKYTETRSFEAVELGQGKAHDDTVDSRTTIYISNRARIFAIGQRNITAFTLKGQPSRSFNLIKSPDMKSQGGDWRFEGSTLYGFSTLGRAQAASVKRIAVRFNPDTQTCTATIGYARPNGYKEIITEGWWRGELYYLRHYDVTSSSCEVKTGNIFNGGAQ
jgi:hypothetical protein